MKISKHMALTIGVVKLKNDYYVLFNPEYINLEEEEVYKASSYYDKMCLDLWGDGTAVKVFVFKADDDFDGLIDIFSLCKSLISFDKINFISSTFTYLTSGDWLFEITPT